jgi:hypothetical protein
MCDINLKYNVNRKFTRGLALVRLDEDNSTLTEPASVIAEGSRQLIALV